MWILRVSSALYSMGGAILSFGEIDKQAMLTSSKRPDADENSWDQCWRMPVPGPSLANYLAVAVCNRARLALEKKEPIALSHKLWLEDTVSFSKSLPQYLEGDLVPRPRRNLSCLGVMTMA